MPRSRVLILFLNLKGWNYLTCHIRSPKAALNASAKYRYSDRNRYMYLMKVDPDPDQIYIYAFRAPESSPLEPYSSSRSLKNVRAQKQRRPRSRYTQFEHPERSRSDLNNLCAKKQALWKASVCRNNVDPDLGLDPDPHNLCTLKAAPFCGRACADTRSRYRIYQSRPL